MLPSTQSPLQSQQNTDPPAEAPLNTYSASSPQAGLHQSISVNDTLQSREDDMDLTNLNWLHEGPCVLPSLWLGTSGDGTGGSTSHFDGCRAKGSREKPPYSFSCLIFLAIEEAPAKQLPVRGIYDWIVSRFPYFARAPAGWKNSVRHNLSLNRCFRKVDRGQMLGKGSLWCVDPVFRPSLLEALHKNPHHPQLLQNAGGMLTNGRAHVLQDSSTLQDSAMDAAAAMMLLKCPRERKVSDDNQMDVPLESTGTCKHRARVGFLPGLSECTGGLIIENGRNLPYAPSPDHNYSVPTAPSPQSSSSSSIDEECCSFHSNGCPSNDREAQKQVPTPLGGALKNGRTIHRLLARRMRMRARKRFCHFLALGTTQPAIDRHAGRIGGTWDDSVKDRRQPRRRWKYWKSPKRTTQMVNYRHGAGKRNEVSEVVDRELQEAAGSLLNLAGLLVQPASGSEVRENAWRRETDICGTHGALRRCRLKGGFN